MKSIQIHPENTFKINYIVHEKNDSCLLISGILRKNNKEYFSNIPIECNQFAKIITKVFPNTGFLDSLTMALFNNDQPINEVSPKRIINQDLFIDLALIVKPMETYRKSA
jgi:hypothetical protein